jgi:hypothetical protein
LGKMPTSRGSQTHLKKNAVFWDMAPCRSCVNRLFGGMYRLHLQSRRIRERGTSVSRCLALDKTDSVTGCSFWNL